MGGSILATAAASVPEVMVKSAGAVLHGFDDLSEQERRLLFETLRVWQESEASVRATAEVFFCHPNTVRHRLHRIERQTGRALHDPRSSAELFVALQALRTLPGPVARPEANRITPSDR